MKDKISPGAMRAARSLWPDDAGAVDLVEPMTDWERMDKRDAIRFLAKKAAIIDRETHCAEMLEVLKQCEDLLAELESGGAENPELALVRAIIAKVEGRQ